MKGMQIFTHSLRQVTGNLPAALKISGLLYGVQLLVGLLLTGLGASATMNGGPGMGFGVGAIISLIVLVITGLWIAVAWHRYVLLVEEPTNFLPEMKPEPMKAYFLRGLLFGVILVIAGAVLGAVVGGIFGGLAMRLGPVFFMLIMALLVQIPIFVIFFRLAAALPGAAIGVDHPITAGWDATKDEWVPMLQLALIVGVCVWVINVIGLFAFGSIAILSFLWQAVTGWLVMMVGVSILTTLYGHYIQKRPLL